MNKQWVEEDGKFILEFSPFYEMETIAEVFEDDGWCYSSELLGADNEYLGSDSLEDAKQEVEDLIVEYFQDEINYNQELLKAFES